MLSHLPFSTVRDLFRYAVSRFNQAKLVYGQGSMSAYDEAAYLILHTLHLPHDTLKPFFDAQLLNHEIDEVIRVIEQRIKERLPASYITNEAWLHGYRFYVDKNVIIPRSFIGELIQQHFAPWVQDPDTVSSILDLCTGSGCLAILAADIFKNAHIDAVEISSRALAIAQHNADMHACEKRISFYEGDLYNPLPVQQYDIIMANPPYVNTASLRALPPEFQHEPRLALAGGDDGMNIIRPIIAGAKEKLKPNGILVIEIGHERMHLEAALGHLNYTWLTTSGGQDKVCLLEYRDLPA